MALAVAIGSALSPGFVGLFIPAQPLPPVHSRMSVGAMLSVPLGSGREPGQVSADAAPHDVRQPPAETWSPAVQSRAWSTNGQAALRAVMEEADRLPDPEKRTELLSALCYRWAENDPRGAIELVFRYQLGQAPGALLENLAQQWAAVDFPGARAWIDSQPEGDEKNRSVARLGFLWSRSEPAAAAQYILDNIPPGPDQTEAAISVLHQWALLDSNSAAAWAMKFRRGALRRRALQEASINALAADSF